MELSEQGQAPLSASMGSQPLASSNVQSAQPAYPAVLYPTRTDWGTPTMFSMGASVPVSSYYIVPMSQQAVQHGASGPETSHHLGEQSMGRVSLRPPQQVLNIQTSMPAMIGSHPSPSTAGKKLQQTVASPKVQMLKSTSFSKRPAQKELPSKFQPQQFESVRSKFRESLADALKMDSDPHDKKQSTENLQADGSADQNKQVYGDEVQDIVTITSKNGSMTNFEAVTADGAKKSAKDEKLSSGLVSNMITIINDDTQKQSTHLSPEDEVSGQCLVVADELLQGHGLCWVSDINTGISEVTAQPNFKRARTSDIDLGLTESLTESESKRLKSADEGTKDKSSIFQKAESLAFNIEEKLFKLFGGVNKKYKERGRSLLFNLKDKSNPELRMRVLSGDIAPERLCSMTAEQLASKELSEWRLAKAEEHDKMVVLPDTEVDFRRLVRKTHKGEFQVEIEETDGISVEVELGGNILSQVPSETVKGKTKSVDKTSGDERTGVEGNNKSSDDKSQDEDGGIGENDSSGNAEYDNEKSDLIEELMVDDLKDAENLPPIPSLDEFMLGLDSEPPFQNLSAEAQQDLNDCDEPGSTLDSKKANETEDKVSVQQKVGSGSDVSSSQDKRETKLESSNQDVGSNLVPAEPLEGEQIRSLPDKVKTKEAPAATMLNHVSAMHSKATTVPIMRESVWEGAIQLTLSSVTNVVAIFKSGEKPPGKEWRSFVEIKGRVKLGAFQQFLEQLPKSRSRALMVTELCWKESSLESGHQHLLQTIDSYIADERVGLAEPADGIELYLCPPQGKAVEILSRHLPKEHLESLAVAATSIIGVVVWRRPNIPRAPSHHSRHDDYQRQSIPRKPQVAGSNSVHVPSHQNSYGAPPGFPNQRHQQEEDVTDDVPPGFGPDVARDEDDLPEFNFVNSSNPAANVTQYLKGRQHVPTLARPVEQMRELVQKYGKNSSLQAHSWDDDDDDDIPEWNPIRGNQQPITQPLLTPTPQPPLPPPPPVQQMLPYQQQHYQQNSLHPLPIMPSNPLPQTYFGTQQQLQPAHTWQPNARWPTQGAATITAPALHNLAQHPQYVATPNNNSAQSCSGWDVGDMTWRPR